MAKICFKKIDCNFDYFESLIRIGLLERVLAFFGDSMISSNLKTIEAESSAVASLKLNYLEERELCVSRGKMKVQKSHSIEWLFCFYGAGTKSRTRDLLITSQLLYQLSYAGLFA